MNNTDIQVLIDEIRNETVIGANTKERIAVVLENIKNNSSQSLQNVIENNPDVEFDNGNSIGSIMGGSENNRYTYFDHTSETQSSGFESSPTRFSAQHFLNGISVSKLRLENGEVKLSKSNIGVTPLKISTIEIETPTNNTNYIFTSKSLDGDYIIATLDDIYSSTSGSIPLSGTTIGSPMVGTFETYGVTFVGNTGVIQHSLELDDNIAMIGFDGTYTSRFVLNLNSSINSFEIGSDDPSFRGLSTGGSDYSPNITDLDYTQKIYVDTKVADSRPYKVYTALLSQTGTNAPTAIVLENTIGSISLVYNSVGYYSLSSVGLFTIDKTVGFITLSQGNTVLILKPFTTNLITLLSFSGNGTTPINDAITKSSIEIRVYN